MSASRTVEGASRLSKMPLRMKSLRAMNDGLNSVIMVRGAPGEIFDIFLAHFERNIAFVATIDVHMIYILWFTMRGMEIIWEAD